MYETPDELDHLQGLLDESAELAGPHMSEIITEGRRLDAVDLCRRLQGLCLLVVATVTADGRPLAGRVDGFFLHGSFYFSSGRSSVRMRHLRARPEVSATYLPGRAWRSPSMEPDICSTCQNPQGSSSARRCSTTTSLSRVRLSRNG